MMPSGHKAFIVNNSKDVELLLMHNRTYAAEYVHGPKGSFWTGAEVPQTEENRRADK